MDVICTHLDGNADVVEFCPDYPFQHILAAATYTLQEGSEPSRIGSVSLFSIQDKNYLKLLQKFKPAGVFDIKWRLSKGNRQPHLAQADSDGNLTIYGLESTENVSEDEVQVAGFIKMKELVFQSISCSSMCLSLDWDQGESSNSNIAVALSDGLVSVVRLGEAQMQIEHAWQAHGFEVWAIAYDSYHPDVLYSGADDCNFCGWDLRERSCQPIFRNTKSHQMGICSIQKCPQWENCVITGSYDECLRLWDMRLMERPLLQKSVCLGGGVWKLKCHPSNGGLVLAACMHNGFTIVRLERDGLKIVEEYKGHNSLAYGADWFKGDLSEVKRCWASAPEIGCIKNGLDQAELLHGADFEYGNMEYSSENSGLGVGRSGTTDGCVIQENAIENGLPGKRERAETAGQETRSLVATCSFYDKALHIWETKCPVYDCNAKSGDTD